MRLPSFLIACGAVLAIPAGAQASSLSVTNGEVLYQAAPGETNKVYIDEYSDCDAWGECTPTFYVAENNDLVNVQTGPGCWRDFSNPDARSFRCERGDGTDGKPTKVHVIGGDGPDDLELNGAVGTLEGGPGQDGLRGGRGADVLDG